VSNALLAICKPAATAPWSVVLMLIFPVFVTSDNVGPSVTGPLLPDTVGCMLVFFVTELDEEVVFGLFLSPPKNDMLVTPTHDVFAYSETKSLIHATQTSTLYVSSNSNSAIKGLLCECWYEFLEISTRSRKPDPFMAAAFSLKSSNHESSSSMLV